MSHIPISLLSYQYSILICQWLSHSGPGGRRPSSICRIPICFPGVSDRHWLERRVPVAARTARLALTVRTVHPGDAHFTQDHCPPPFPPHHTSYNIVMVWADRKDWNPTKQKRAKHAAFVLKKIRLLKSELVNVHYLVINKFFTSALEGGSGWCSPRFSYHSVFMLSPVA